MGIFAGVSAFAADYVILWSYQDWRNAPVRSHTFASFIRTDGDRVSSQVDISWLPAPGYFRNGLEMPPLRIVPGQNYSLSQTLGFAAGLNQPVRRFGPYAISPELFAAAVRQSESLASGRVAYKMLDGGSRPGAINCIHAVTDIAGYTDTGLARGAAASQAALHHLFRSGHARSQVPDENLFQRLRPQIISH